MTLVRLCSWVLFWLFSHSCIAQNEDTSIPFVLPMQCNRTQFYNTASLQCSACGSHQSRSLSGLLCVCHSGFTVRDLGSPLVQCSTCNGTVSLDQRRCLQCLDSRENCVCGAGQTLVENLSNLTASCVACPSTTVGEPGRGVCVLCQETFYAVTGTCTCPGKQLLGGLCFNDTSSAAVQGSVPPASIWFRLYLDSSFLACTIYNNITACQLLTNMAVLDPAGVNSKAFHLYRKAASQAPPLPFLPQLFYSEDPALPLGQTAPTGLTFHGNTKINLKVVKFDARGRFLGWEDVAGGTLQLCADTQQRLAAAYFFGTTYQQSCSIPVLELLSRYPEPVFYQLFLKYQDRNGVDKVWPVPVQYLNQMSSTPDRSLAKRRFFLVDALTGRDSSVTQQSLHVRYLSHLLLSVNVPTSGPRDMPPFQLMVQYCTVSDPANTAAQVLFSVTYSMNEENMQRGTAISIGVLGILALLLAMLETNSWSHRAGQQYLSLTTIVKFLAFLIGNLGNAFFLVTFGTGVYWLIVFKGQKSTVDMVLPSPGGSVETDFIIFLSLAFTFKALQLIHMLIVQVSISIFLIDWEKPRNSATTAGLSQGPTVSAWRTFFVANEWNEIQTTRKLNVLLQLLTVLLILKVVGVENIASRDLKLVLQPEGSEYSAPMSPILRYGLTVSVWLAVGLVQVLFYLAVYERFVEDKFRQFVDLCAISNVSVFILMHRCYGYYIHGRSVHGHADINMEAMRANLRREEENLCALRGLEPDSDTQTFELALTERVRQQLERIMLPLTEASGARGRRSGNEGPQREVTKAYHTMNRFLSSFLEHVHKDMDYIVKDKLLLERILNYEFQLPIERTIFYRDPDGVAFTNVLYYNNELTLLLFDTLLFCIIDLSSKDMVLAAVLTYAVQQLFDILRYYISRRNVSEKTLVDQCFLI